MRLCFACKKNHPAVSYERKVRGGVEIEHYCLACYENKFLSVNSDGHEDGKTYEVCPCCGAKADEVKKTALVGCAKCYHTLGVLTVPMVIRMQQNSSDVHRGKSAVDGEGAQRSNRRKELQTLAYPYEKMGDAVRARACLREVEELDIEGAQDGRGR